MPSMFITGDPNTTTTTHTENSRDQSPSPALPPPSSARCKKPTSADRPPRPASSHADDTPNYPKPTHACPNTDSEESKQKFQKVGKDLKGDAARTQEEGNDEDNLTEPDLTQDEVIDLTPFAFKPYRLASLVDPKNLESLEAIGGIKGLLAGLGVDPTTGLSTGGKTPETREASSAVFANSADEEFMRGGAAYDGTIEDRHRVYGSNVLPAPKCRSLLALMWLALKDKALVLLSIAAVVSLALGFFRGPGKPLIDLVEGAAIVVAIFIVVMVSSLNDWQKERQLRILNDEMEERRVRVVRAGSERVIGVKELVVGDIALLEPGEIVPCDGVFISGHSVKCNEPGATGDSDSIRKVGYDECIAARERTERAGASTHGLDTLDAHADCFMVSGSKVLEGYGKYVVIAVGQKSFNGRIMTTSRGEPELIPLQEKLKGLTELTTIGGGTGLAICTALMIRSLMYPGIGESEHTSGGNGHPFLRIVIVSATLIFAAVPEGFPLAITLALAFATKQATVENILIRVPESCEAMAEVTVVCTDTTATLTQNVMSVVAGSIGIYAKFVRNLKEDKTRMNGTDQGQDMTGGTGDFSIEQRDINATLSPQLKRLFNQSIVINSTAFEDIDSETDELTFAGSKTEAALLQFARELDLESWKETRESVDIVHMIPFSSERKAMGVVVRLQSGRYRLFLKGASEVLAKKCTRHVVISKNQDQGQDPDSEIETATIDETAGDNTSRTIDLYANQALRTIALCYRDFESWPPTDSRFRSVGEVPFEDISCDMTLVTIIAIEAPLHPGVRDAVTACHCAGVAVKICTGENVLTARSIAAECGIYTAEGIIMEGPAFRALDARQRLEVVPRLQVLARSSPEDKTVLVETLRSLGEIVGVTGDGADDVPALKAANVGFSMGIAGTEVAKEASDIILVDDDFGSIVKAIMWGRCVNDSVRKFLQFHTSANITTLIVTFLYLLAPANELLTVPQLFWIHTVVATLTALALTTGPVSKYVLDKKPDIRGRRLFTADMMKMILGQSGYQVIILLAVHFLGHRILGLGYTDEDEKVLMALAFNTSFFGQIFNSLNCRRIDNKLNIFEGILGNGYFIMITLIEIVGQILIVSVGGAAFQVTRIHGREWGISLALGFVSIPLGALIRCIPTPPLERVFMKLRIMKTDEVLPTTRPDTAERIRAINNAHDNSSLFSSPRSGRADTSSFSEGDPIALSTFVASSVDAGLTT